MKMTPIFSIVMLILFALYSPCSSAQYGNRRFKPLELSLEQGSALRFSPIHNADFRSRIDNYGNGHVYISLNIGNTSDAGRGRMVVKVLRADDVVASSVHSLELNSGQTRVASRLYISPDDLNSNMSFKLLLELYGKDRKLADTQSYPFSFPKNTP